MIVKKIHIIPVSASRPRVTKRGTFYAKPYNDFKESFTLLLGAKKLLSGALSASIQLSIPMPKSWTKKKKAEMLGEYHIQKPDSDNYAKAILDGMNGIFYDDDSQIAQLHIVKRWGVDGYINIKLCELTEAKHEHENQSTIYDIKGVK